MRKAEIAKLLAEDPRTFHSATEYAKRYTIPELLALVDAYGYNDLHCREARKLFDAVTWSRQLRTNKSLWLRVQDTFGNANEQILR